MALDLDAIRTRCLQADERRDAWCGDELFLDAIPALLAEVERLQRENDALKEDLRGDCASCAHRDESAKSDVCQGCPRPGGAGFGNWKWRGPKLEG